MTLVTIPACGFNNAQSQLSYTYDDSFTPPEVTQLTLQNQGGSFTFNVQLRDRTTDQVVATYSHNVPGGANIVVTRQQIVAQFGDLRMVQSVGKDGSTGWAFPYLYNCWTS